MSARILFFVALGSLIACGDETPPPLSPAAVKAAPAAAACPNVVDPGLAAALLARHAKAYGSAGAVEALLPISLVETTKEGQITGFRETNLTADATRVQALLGPIHVAYGIIGGRAWTMGAGVVEQLTPNEGVEAALASWLLRKRYTLASELATASVSCKPRFDGGRRLDIVYGREDLGKPELQIDLDSASLFAVYHNRPDGRRELTTYEAWSEPDHGVRWPQRKTDHIGADEETPFELTSHTHGLTCSRVDASGRPSPDRGDACVAPPPERLAMRWPAADAQGRVLARVPFTYLGNEILVHVKIGGRDVNALLDSGAATTAVDATSPAGESFRVMTEINGAGSTQRLRLGLGEIPKIQLGDLVVEHVSAANVPLPVLETLGSQRPEVILGYAFFAENVVRIDYVNHELIFAKKKDGLLAKGKDTRELPFRVLDFKMVATGVVDGVEIPFAIDTGNGSGLDIYKRWGTAHDFPGARPVASMTGHVGAGAAATTALYFRIAKASVGPIAYDDQLAAITDPPDSGIIGALAGNTVLARCDAAVFDMPMRTITLEGTCNRPIPQRRVGWTFKKNTDIMESERPFVVDAIFPGGGADAAGVRIGDRLLDIGGKPATTDVGTWWPLEEQPAGTKLPITVARGGSSVKLVIELRDLGR